MARAGESRDHPWAPLLEQDQAIGNSPPLPCFTRRSFQLWLSHSCCSSFSLLVLDGSFPWKPTLGRAAGWDKHG